MQCNTLPPEAVHMFFVTAAAAPAAHAAAPAAPAAFA